MMPSLLRYPFAVLAMALAGCTTTSLQEAPIVERSEQPGARPPAAAAAAPAPALREAKAGHYVVQRGDTLYSIALAFGQDFRDLARWNGLDDPSRLQVGQSLRVEPAPGDAPPVAAVPVAPPPALEVRPLDAPAPLPPVAAGAKPAPVPPISPAVAPSVSTPVPAVVAPAVPPVVPPILPSTAPPAAAPSPAAPPKSPVVADSALAWAWPAAGTVIEPFNEARNKGIDIGGTEGDPVLAAGDGTVVYGGSGLRGYGNLVIIKHTDDFISAYAHNRQILVKQGQAVKRGQRIAELGRTDAELPKLHFEIRRQGKPVDPVKYLPGR